MSKISVLPSEITKWLSEQAVLNDIRFLTEYPAVKKEIPLKRVTASIGIEKLKLEDSFTPDGNGVLIENEYCRQATIKIKIGIHVPYSEGGAKCHDVLTRVIDCLTFATDLNILESGCSDTKADRDTDSFVLDAYLLIGANFCPADSTGLNFKSFLDKELLCGSHIRNKEIHVTQADKDLWNRPFVVGTYSGTGATTRSVAVGFHPMFVIAYAVEMPVSAWDYDKKQTRNYFGFASDGGGTIGINLNHTGFSINSSSTFGDGYFEGNALGYSYIYFAFKRNI